MASKNVKITEKLMQQLISSIAYYTQTSLADRGGPNYIDMGDKFDVEGEIFKKVMNTSIASAVGILSEFLKISAAEKNKIEALHEDIMASVLLDSQKIITPLEIETFQKDVKRIYGYDFSDLAQLEKKFKTMQ